MLLAACSGFSPVEQPPNSFIPPTVAPNAASTARFAPTPTPTIFIELLRPTATLACTNVLGFLEDITVPDGTIAAPGELLEKRWKVANAGTCNWDARYRIKLISGPEMGAVPEQALYPARGGVEFEIHILFQAPEEPATYRSAWQAVNPQGETFGDPFYIEIVVEASSP
jgi:hypothetical protein